MTWYAWLAFSVFISFLLALDLGIINKKPHALSIKEALWQSLLWISIGLLFTGFVYYAYEHHWGGNGAPEGFDAAGQYLTAYLIEKALSVDNIFVIAMLFSFFQVPSEYQHRVLFWGILGAIFFRAIMIFVGVALVTKFTWVFYIFGALLVYTSIKMMRGHEDLHPEDSRIVKWARKVIPISDSYDGAHFVTHKNGHKEFTLLFLVLIVIEATDILFAVDSIPAILGMVQEPFIVLTSNVFAILGLRALYFVVAGAMNEFRYLSLAVSIILIMIGFKMIFFEWTHDWPPYISLIAVASLLTLGILASLWDRKRQAAGQ